jgi:fructose-1-phosphate kinase PfkB-like protein
MIYTVTVNPCLDEDKEFDTDCFIPKNTYRAKESRKYPGGKGIDVSRAIHAAGSDSVATGFIGGRIGELVLGLLAIEGITCDFIRIDAETRTNVICKMKAGGEIRINSPGPEISGHDYHQLVEKIRGYKDAEAALVCGSVCPGMQPICSYNQILLAFKENNKHCLTFLDTGEQHTTAALARKCSPDFIKPNIYEFHRLLRAKVNTLGIAPPGNDNPASISEDLLERYYCMLHDDLPTAWQLLVDRLYEFNSMYHGVQVLLSVSRFGAITLRKDDVIHAFYCRYIEPETTVGAGDSFLGGFATSYVEHAPNDLETALTAGVAASSARLQGQHRDFGYIDQERLQEITASKDLRIESFPVAGTKRYVSKTLMPCFQTAGNGTPPAQSRA